MNRLYVLNKKEIFLLTIDAYESKMTLSDLIDTILLEVLFED